MVSAIERKAHHLQRAGHPHFLDLAGLGEPAFEVDMLEGCERVLCSKIGIEPWGRLEAAGIKPDGEHGMEVIEEAVMTVWRELLATGKLATPAAARKRA